MTLSRVVPAGGSGFTDLRRKYRDLPGRPAQQPPGHALDMIMLTGTPAEARTSEPLPHLYRITQPQVNKRHMARLDRSALSQ
jgi:hypothetical protein